MNDKKKVKVCLSSIDKRVSDFERKTLNRLSNEMARELKQAKRDAITNDVSEPRPLSHRAHQLADYYLQPEKLEQYTYALSDVLCWLDGFVAAGGKYSPGSVETLRNINDALKSIQAEQARSNLSHG